MMKNKGFTLIEVMIVIAVIGIIAVVATPKYQVTRDQYKLEAAAQTVVTELRYAKQLAMDQRTNCFVVFSESKVTVMQANGKTVHEVEAKPFEAGIVFDIHRNAALSDLVFEGTSLGKGFQYDPKGFAVNDGITILNNSKNRTVTIDVAPQTGIVSIVWP